MAGAIRQPIDIEALSRYIEKTVPEIKTPIEVKQFGYGQSNPTYQLTDKNGKKFVMRKKPPGKLLSKTAHQVEREYRIIHALEKTNVPVPKAYCLCEDDKIVGTPFYIMEFLDGRIFEDPAFPGVSESDRTEMWKSAVQTLAQFHKVAPSSVGLSDFGRSGGFYSRQLKTFGAIQDAQANAKDKDTGTPVGKIPHYDDMVSFFSNPKTQPTDRSSFVHGDYKIDNVVFHKTEPRVIGILDWEMATIGHPLSDIVNLLSPHTQAAQPNASQTSTRLNKAFIPASRLAGLPTKQQCLDWYCQVSGYDAEADIGWGDAFGVYRGTIIIQGIAARYAMGVASSASAKEYAVQLRPFAETCWRMIQKLKSDAGGKASL